MMSVWIFDLIVGIFERIVGLLIERIVGLIMKRVGFYSSVIELSVLR